MYKYIFTEKNCIKIILTIFQIFYNIYIITRIIVNIYKINIFNINIFVHCYYSKIKLTIKKYSF